MSNLIISTLVTALLATLAATSAVPELSRRTTGGYLQKPSGDASFTVYSGCGAPACGQTATGFTAAMSQLSFGAAGGDGAGDACGRCYAITGNSDPYSDWYQGPFFTIVVKVNNLCPEAPGERWCGQTRENPTNQYGKSVHFDLCSESGAADAFFPSDRGALLGNYTEVSCSQWSGYDGSPLWNGACLKGETAENWPAVACGNRGTAP